MSFVEEQQENGLELWNELAMNGEATPICLDAVINQTIIATCDKVETYARKEMILNNNTKLLKNREYINLGLDTVRKYIRNKIIKQAKEGKR